MKIGFVSTPFVGHLNPMTTLARRLQSRGHEVAFIGVPDVEPFARAAGLDFAGMLLVSFSAMNYFTHIGLLMNTSDSF
jgi:UDP:flavonoid glycosyltransferase YjiC (YdhE family)